MNENMLFFGYIVKIKLGFSSSFLMEKKKRKWRSKAGREICFLVFG